MVDNFFWNDMLGVCLAAILFPLFLIPPGYALGWLLNLVSFRTQPANIRFLLSLPLTVALTPVLFYLLGRISLGWPIGMLFGCALIATFVLRPWQGLGIPPLAWIATGFWSLVATLSLVDLQFGRRAYFSVVAYDYTFRSALVGAITRASSLPAVNPFFYPGHAEPFRYHYLWFLLCSLPSRFAHLNPRHSLIGATIWAGMALMATVVLYVRLYLKERASSRWGIALLFICGLDIFPILGLDVVNLTTGKLGFPPTVDWWNADQVASWLDTMLWVPHNVAAIIACFIGFLILSHETRLRWPAVIAAALAFASSVGLSIYVTLVFAIFLSLWTVMCFIHRDFTWARLLVASGVLSAVLAAPFLLELLSARGTGATISFGMRHFDPAHMIAQHFSIVSGSKLMTLIDTAALPLNYFIELGVLLVIGVARWRCYGVKDLPGWVMIATSLAVVTFFRANTLATNNDLGARGMLIVQFMLVVWGAALVPELLNSRQWRTVTRATILFGVMTSVYELAILRLYPALLDARIVPPIPEISRHRDLGERTFSSRHVYEAIDRVAPRTAIVQHGPFSEQDIFAGLYSNRQMSIMDLKTAIGFTGHEEASRELDTPLEDLFAGKRDDADAICREFSIDYLVIKDIDPIWKDMQSWLWKRPLLFRAERAAAVSCGALGMR
jgi:hypothetical protein